MELRQARSTRILLAVAVALAAVVGLQSTRPDIAQATGFSCGPLDEPNGHCYNLVSWRGPTNGAYTEIRVPANWGIASSRPAGEHMNFTVWLSDDSAEPPGYPGTCGSPVFGYCWVEVGLQSRARTSSKWPALDHIYWAEVRPAQGYADFFLRGVNSSEYGKTFRMRISRNPSVSYSWWITPPSLPELAGYSSPNNMTSDRIAIGGELFVYNPTNTISYNSGGWWTHSKNQYKDPVGGGWWYQFRLEDIRIHHVPWQGDWASKPFNGLGNTGGRWTSLCCGDY
jgi:hypothetical protein